MSMMKNAIGGSILFAALALGFGACGPVVPDQPTWQHDIRPLMVARCIRCHDGAGHVDPATSPTVRAFLPVLAIYNFNYEVLPATLPAGLAILHSKIASTIVRGPSSGIPIMPPPPAEKLEDWEIQLLDNWVAEMPAR